MRKFEVGKVYGEDAVKYEVVKRTAKFVTILEVHHFGKFNEIKKSQPFFKTFAGKTEKAMFLNEVASAFKCKNAIPTKGRNCIFATQFFIRRQKSFKL